MIAYEIESMIREDVSVDIHFDLNGVERVAESIASRFAALEAENARLRAALEEINKRDSYPPDGYGVWAEIARKALEVQP
jgi:hypothetical protein